MKPFVFLIALAGVGVGAGLGFFLGWRAHPAPFAANADTGARPPEVPAPPGKSAEAIKEEGSGLVGLTGSQGSPKVKALFAGFDPRKPVASQLVVLQKIMAASPADLAEMAKWMVTGDWRNDALSWQTRTAVMQRWVELAPDEAIAWAKVAQKGGENSYRAGEIFGMLATVDPKRAMDGVPRITDSRHQNVAIRSVIGAIAQADPEQAFRWCETLPRDKRPYEYLFNTWAERDAAAAAASLMTLKDRGERGRVSSSLMSIWARQDPAGALAWAKGLTEPGMRQPALRSYFDILGRRDPETAAAQIAELPRSQQRGFFSTLVRVWTQTDPDAAGAWMLARPDALDRQRLITAAVEENSYLYLGSEQASRLVSQLPPGSAREQAMNQVIARWMQGDSDAAIAFSKSLPAVEEMKLREQIVQGLASRDPDKAMAYLKDNPIDDPASQVWRGLAATIASTSSPAKALEWVNALPDESSRRKALPGLLWQMAQENPAEAAVQAAALPDEATRVESLAIVAGIWAGAGLDDAMSWATGLAGKDREAAMGTVLRSVAPVQPTLAAEQFDALITAVPSGTKPADELLSAAATIAGAYFGEDAQAAAQWASSLPQDDARAAAVRIVSERWAQYDPIGASEWIGTLPGGKPRDVAVGQLIDKIAYSDPATAFAWASTTSDSDDRSMQLQTTLASWRKLDAPAARTAIQATDWSEDEKSKWLDKVK